MNGEERSGLRVHLDSTPENMTPTLALQATRVLEERWNGWLRPLATEPALRRLLEAWRANDPNGTWGEAREIGNRLIYIPSDSDAVEDFPTVGQDPHGLPLFDLTGWAWVTPR